MKHLTRNEWRASQVTTPNQHATVIHARITSDIEYLDKLALLDTIHAEIDPALDAQRLAYFGMVIPEHESYIDLMDKVLIKLASQVPDNDLVYDTLSDTDSNIVPVLYSDLSRI